MPVKQIVPNITDPAMKPEIKEVEEPESSGFLNTLYENRLVIIIIALIIIIIVVLAYFLVRGDTAKTRPLDQIANNAPDNPDTFVAPDNAAQNQHLAQSQTSSLGQPSQNQQPQPQQSPQRQTSPKTQHKSHHDITNVLNSIQTNIMSGKKENVVSKTAFNKVSETDIDDGDVDESFYTENHAGDADSNIEKDYPSTIEEIDDTMVIHCEQMTESGYCYQPARENGRCAAHQNS